ncbi:MAG: hypothetical protein EAY75_18295 [Bacteroidetes bacterium]|nr:MAG: hypothetical protein EAY75_18295 [Bacteroidota bacterium]
MGFAALSQTTDTTDTDLTDYGAFADAAPVKRYATQKVLNQSAQKLISVGYEYHGGHDVNFTSPSTLSGGANAVSAVKGLRLLANFPVISNDKAILSFGAQYWHSNYNVAPKGTFQRVAPLDRVDVAGLTTAGVFGTFFKPLSQKRMLIFQAEANLNGSYNAFANITAKGLTWGGSALYAWKKNDKTMTGVGISRTYRMGRPIVVPVFYSFKTYNDRWGHELILPARGFLRHNINTKNLLMLGYELEGNQFEVESGGRRYFLQRGEIKPRLQFEKQLKNFIWMSMQAGMRLNGRFEVVNAYNEHASSKSGIRTNLDNAFYFNFSINLISP